MKIFILIWFGQLVSMIGSGLTSFALGVWVYQQTGSTTQFALISLFASLPFAVISPLAGVLVDRWDRRWTMILSDSGAGLCSLAIFLLLVSNWLAIWHIYLATALISTFAAFQSPAYIAISTLIVPKQHLSRASGMAQLGEATARLISPVLAGFLVVSIQLHGIIMLDLMSFLFAVGTLWHALLSASKRVVIEKTQKGSLLQQAVDGWMYIITRSGLFALLLFSTVTNFLVGHFLVLITPLVLSFASAPVLGAVMSTSGIGMLLGGLTISIWGGPRRYINATYGFVLLGGLCIFAAGLRPSIPLITVAVFLGSFGWPIVNTSRRVILQKKSPPLLQGRIFACYQTFSALSLPFAYGVAGPLADQIFEPLMATDGLLASTIGQIIGIGPGRGIGLLFICIGLLLMLTTVLAYMYLPLRLVEEQLPDAILE